MCQQIKRILVKKSRTYSEIDKTWKHCATVCKHGIVGRYVCHRQSGACSVLIGKTNWAPIPITNVPPEVLEFFRDREIVPPPNKPKKSLIERRAIAAATQLKKWKRRQKLANTKVKHYTRKVSAYKKKVPQAELLRLLEQVPSFDL